MKSHSKQQLAVLLVDDHRGMREALARLLQANGFSVFAEASTRAEALTLVAAEHPGLALVDLSLGSDDGMALVTDLDALDISVVVLSSHEASGYVWQALNFGARAYVSKRDARRVLIRTLQDVLDGWVLVSPGAAQELLPAGQRGTDPADNREYPQNERNAKGGTKQKDND